MRNPRHLQERSDDDGTASATQLSILLASATSASDEEFRRAERLDGKARNQIVVAGAFFAAVQAAVISLLNGILSVESGPTSSFAVWLGILGVIAGCTMLVALLVSYRSWKLLDDPVLATETIKEYVPYASAGNSAVGVKLVEAYADITEGRRANNELRAVALEVAGRLCAAVLAVAAIELVVAFIAVAVQ